MAQLLSVNVGLPREIEWKGKTVRTAVWKDAVRGRRKVDRLNIDGDGQGDLQVTVASTEPFSSTRSIPIAIGKGSWGERTSCLDNSARTSRRTDCRTMRCALVTVIGLATRC